MKPVKSPSIGGDIVQVAPSPSVTLTIDVDNTIFIDNQVVVGEDALQQRFKEIAALPDQPTLFIKANKKAGYKIIAAILADAKRLGVIKIGLIGQQ